VHLSLIATFSRKRGGIERENEMLLKKLINDDEVEKITIISPIGFDQIKDEYLKNKKVEFLVKLNFGKIPTVIEIVNNSDLCLITNVRPTAIPVHLFKSKKVKTVQVVHDIIPWLHPEYFPTIAGLTYKTFKILVKNKPNIYIVHSEHTKNDLIKYWRIDPKKIIKVCYGSFVKPVAPRENFGSKKILFVSTIEPRKGVDKLLDAFLIVKKEIPEARLIIVGKIGWKAEYIFEKIRKFVDLKIGVEYLGYVSDEELAKLYSEADVFVYPSVYEGFGAPPLEAMSCGCPVAVSKTSSIPEVVGEAGIYFNPQDVNDIAKSLIKILRDDELKIELSKRGIERAKMFNWDKCLEEFVSVLKFLIKN
jgi:glycosyltransferase involved in cell wall biosynthesis